MSIEKDPPEANLGSPITQNETEIRQCWFQSPIPRSIDDFTFDEEQKIGEGTYGTVFRARDKQSGEIVALKRLKISQRDSGIPITSIREIRILNSLRHDNIIELKEVIVDSEINRNRESECIYLVFEYMEHDLAGLNKFRGRNFIQGQIRCYMKQLLEGLYYCHQKNILHRDIKGANMLINKEGILKLGDFGLARKYKTNSNFTRPVVTLWYRAPELLLEAKTYTSAIDMWSVGCLLAELYIGNPLLPGKTEVEQIDRIYKLCGTPTPENWPEGTELPAFKNFQPKKIYNRNLKQHLRHCKHSISSEALDLIDKLLEMDPLKRITAEQALDHEYFYSPEMTLTPADLPKYDGQLNELYSKRTQTNLARKIQPKTQSQCKIFKDNEGKPRYRTPERTENPRFSLQGYRPRITRNPEYQPPRGYRPRYDNRRNSYNVHTEKRNYTTPTNLKQPRPRDYRELN